jgi:hypothetical protein
MKIIDYVLNVLVTCPSLIKKTSLTVIPYKLVAGTENSYEPDIEQSTIPPIGIKKNILSKEIGFLGSTFNRISNIAVSNISAETKIEDIIKILSEEIK